ncbi:MAG: NUDIX hydrolase [Gammaproteobacteria bacterium]|nr:NUDIX hydrolase [Gammaproteobacteria bacterium]
MTDDPIRWQKISSEPGPELPLFDVRFDQMRHPGTGDAFRRMVLEAPDWTNVVATTEEGDIIMVEQYRFGIEDLTVEPVGGIIDADEEPIDAAKRELLEETGYGGGSWQSLGVVQANPAIHNNLCHLWRADGVRLIQDQELDPGESIRVHLMSVHQVKKAIAAGRFLHPLGLAAMSRAFSPWSYEPQRNIATGKS